MTEMVIKVLALAAGPQTATEIRDGLRRLGHKAEDHEILKELRALQRQNIVRVDGIRWRLLQSPSVAGNVNQDSRHLSPHLSGSSPAVAPSTAVFATPSDRSPTVIEGRWAVFRRLCQYYMDCLLQDEAPQLSAYVENEDDTWLTLNHVPWARIAAGGNMAVSLSRDQAPFQRNRVKRGEEECIYLCYPVRYVKPKGKQGFVVPMFAQPMTANWQSGVLHLEPDGPIAVNGSWLDYQFHKRDERVAFLRAMGFLSDADSAEDDNGATAPIGPRDFARLAQDAAHYVHHPDHYADHIEPLKLRSDLEWSKAQPGMYNMAMLTLGPRLRYTRSLLRDLRDISEKMSDEDLDGTALAGLFPHDSLPVETDDSASEPPLSDNHRPAFEPQDLAQCRLLHPKQRDAVVNSLAEPVSVVTGPPGTGKSEVVSSMMLNQLLRGQATLFASKNHQALEAVLPRLNGAVDGGDLVVQTSSRELAQRQNYLGKLQTLLTRPHHGAGSDGEKYLREYSELFGNQRASMSDLAMLERARTEYEAMSDRLHQLREYLPIAVRSDEAISDWPSDFSRERVETLEMRLREALAPPIGIFQKIRRALFRQRALNRCKDAREPLTRLPVPYVDRPLPDVGAISSEWDDFFVVWKAWAEAAQVLKLARSLESQIRGMPQADACNQRLAAIQQGIEKLTGQWMNWAASGLPSPISPSDRQDLANLRAGIQTWGPTRFARELKKHFPLILRVFPLWSVSNLSARSALPLSAGLFDLAIIDEASQCDIPSVVPLLARARRVVFAGDPMQLKHVSNLDTAIDRSLLQQYGLTESNVQRFTYRVNSAFDLADASSMVPESARVRLDLHFRSHDLIADYCNEAFYAKTLHVVTVTDRLHIPQGMKPGIHWTHVAGKMESGTTGAWSADEIGVVRGELAKLAEARYRGTVGVVTPFRQQMIRLRDSLETGDVLPRDFLEQIRFMASTAHGFQGDERDLIIFSLCGGPDMPQGATIFLRENPNLFNVAVSRARAVLHVVGNKEWALNCRIPFIEKLARRTLPSDGSATRTSDEPYQSPWEKVLEEALNRAGVSVVPQYPIAGRFLDLAILGPIKIDVEVDGEAHHRTAGGGRKDDDHWRDLQLQSLGWKVCRFWVYELREDMNGCVGRVRKLLMQE